VYVHAGDASPAGNITFVAQERVRPVDVARPGRLVDHVGDPRHGARLDDAGARLHTVTHNLQDALDASAYGGASLPVIGHSLDAGAKIVEKLNTNFVDPMNDIATTLDGAADFTAVETTIRNGIWDHLGGGTGGIGLVLPYDASLPDTTVPSAGDIHVTLRCGKRPAPLRFPGRFGRGDHERPRSASASAGRSATRSSSSTAASQASA